MLKANSLHPPKKKVKVSRSKLSSGSSKNSKKKLMRNDEKEEEKMQLSQRSIPSSKSSKKDIIKLTKNTSLNFFTALEKKLSNSSLGQATPNFKDVPPNRKSDLQKGFKRKVNPPLPLMEKKTKNSINVALQGCKFERKTD